MKQVMDRKKKQEIIAHLESLMKTEGKVRYAHLPFGRNEDGVITIAVTANNTEPGTANYGWAICEPNDQFDRLEGRLRALRRLVGRDKRREYRSRSDFPLSALNPVDLCETMALDLFGYLDSNNLLPYWA